MTETPAIAVVVLAAGKGTRMRSDRPKVLHEIAHLPMLHHVLDTAAALVPTHLVLVLAPGMDEVAASARDRRPDVKIAIQEEALGTGHAVMSAMPALEGFAGTVIVLYADTPLLPADTLADLASAAGEGAAVLGFRPDDAAQYGRLRLDTDGSLLAIVEFADADEAVLAIDLCNSGVMAIGAGPLGDHLPRLGNDNAKGEYYLTDLVALLRDAGLETRVVEADPDDVVGVNSRIELAAAEAIYQRRLRQAAMATGVTLIDPDTVYFAHDTRLGRDVVVGPHVVFGPGVSIGDHVTIRPYSHLEGADVGMHAVIGPFARLRPGTVLGENVHIGNFVEVKKASLGPGAKVNHLSYIGDAQIGARTNIGAGTITCNYDGVDKHRTLIGEDAFIGSDTLLVAPVSVGDGAFTGSGTVVTRDLEAGALGLTRPDWRVVKGWGERFRARKAKAAARKANTAVRKANTAARKANTAARKD